MAETEYIEREALIEEAKHNKAVCQAIADIVDVKDIINNTPSADVTPVRHGHWIPQFVSKRGLSDHFMCSECAESTFTPRKFEMIKYAYCPNCGAKLC